MKFNKKKLVKSDRIFFLVFFIFFSGCWWISENTKVAKEWWQQVEYSSQVSDGSQVWCRTSYQIIQWTWGNFFSCLFLFFIWSRNNNIVEISKILRKRENLYKIDLSDEKLQAELRSEKFTILVSFKFHIFFCC